MPFLTSSEAGLIRRTSRAVSGAYTPSADSLDVTYLRDHQNWIWESAKHYENEK